MAIKISAGLTNRIVNAGIVGYMNNCSLKLYNGTYPTSADAGSSGTMLIEIGTAGINWRAATSGTAKLSGTYSGTSVAAGTVTYGRLVGTASTHVIQGSAGSAAGLPFVLDLQVFSGAGEPCTLLTCDIVQSAG